MGRVAIELALEFKLTEICGRVLGVEGREACEGRGLSVDVGTLPMLDD